MLTDKKLIIEIYLVSSSYQQNWEDSEGNCWMLNNEKLSEKLFKNADQYLIAEIH